jgi:hypothetical protein
MSFGEYHRDAANKSRKHAYLDTDTYRNCGLEQFAKLPGIGSENVLRGRFRKNTGYTSTTPCKPHSGAGFSAAGFASSMNFLERFELLQVYEAAASLARNYADLDRVPYKLGGAFHAE